MKRLAFLAALPLIFARTVKAASLVLLSQLRAPAGTGVLVFNAGAVSGATLDPTLSLVGGVLKSIIPTGTGGTGTSPVFVSEIPTSNGTGGYILTGTPIAGSLDLYRNGLRQVQGTLDDFILTGSTITFNTVIGTPSSLVANYRK